MRKLYLGIAGISLALLGISCGGQSPSASSADEAQSTNEAVETMADVEPGPPLDGPCNYFYSQEATSVAWTAFKFTEKTGVGGKFDDFMVEVNEPANTVEELLQSLRVSIPIGSVNTNNPDRDEKIMNHFFGTINTENIEAQATALDMEAGTITMSIKMNGQEQSVPLNVEVADNKVSIKGSISVDIWDGLPGIEALNKVCYDLHTGADGISKLWPDVDIVIESTLEKDCQGI